MTDHRVNAPQTETLPSEHLIRTRYDVEFDARSDVWQIDGKKNLNVATFRAQVSAGLLPGLELTLRDAARRYSPSTLEQYLAAVKHYRRIMQDGRKIARWDLAAFQTYRATLLRDFGHEDYLRQIRSLLTNWRNARHPGVSQDLIDELNQMKLKPAEYGRAVRVKDGSKGALAPLELHSVLQGLHDGAEHGSLRLGEYCLGFFHVMSGRRPKQTASMKCVDIIETMGDPEPEFPEGRMRHLIAVPRAKQAGHGFRETRRAIDLTPTNFLVFRAQRDSVQEDFKHRLRSMNWAVQPKDLKHVLGQLPLFPDWNAIDKGLSSSARQLSDGEHAKAINWLLESVTTAAFHLAAQTLASQARRICESVVAASDGGSPLHVTPARLRHTKGTDLAREGLPRHVIAWLLDHSTSRSADIYVDNIPEHAAEVNEALGTSTTLKRFASAFRGTLVDAESNASAGDKPTLSRIAYGGKGTATCGLLKQCGLDDGIPYACYTCSHFQPWLDGPHDELLSELQAERAQAVEELGEESPVSRKRDRLIGAVQQVIVLVNMRRTELSATGKSGDSDE